MPKSTPMTAGGRTFYLVGTVLAALALALGLWDVMVERDGGDWFWTVGFPAALLVFMLILYLRTPRL